MELSTTVTNRIIFGLVILVMALAVLLLYSYLVPSMIVKFDTVDDFVVDMSQLKAPPSPFLKSEEVVIVGTSTSSEQAVLLPIEKVLFEFVEVVDGCGPHFEGECLRVRSGPGTDYPVVERLRNGIVLKVGGRIERDGVEWYKIVFDEWLRYPERVKGDWYVAAEHVRILLDEGVKTVWENEYATTTKKTITVSRSDQMLYAFEGNELFLETPISTGLELTPTPRGTFTVFKKMPSRYMQGPLPNLPSRDYYDLPGVPWNLYFTEGGAVIHGAYWHTSFGSAYSHGCVNLEPSIAEKLYNWAELGTTVIVKD
jgi:hypothetical protein